MSSIPSRVQRQFAQVSPGTEIVGSFEVADDEAAGGDAWIAAIPGELSLVVAAVSIPRYVSKAVAARDLLWAVPRRFFVIVTRDGLALGRKPKWPQRNNVKEWIHLPNEALRYELDPGTVSAAQGEVEITIGRETYWALGIHRDAAYRYFDRQRTAAAG